MNQNLSVADWRHNLLMRVFLGAFICITLNCRHEIIGFIMFIITGYYVITFIIEPISSSTLSTTTEKCVFFPSRCFSTTSHHAKGFHRRSHFFLFIELRPHTISLTMYVFNVTFFHPLFALLLFRI